MQRYIHQLLNDIETSIRAAPNGLSAFIMNTPFMDADDRMHREYMVLTVELHDLFGLNKGIFPPVERLTKDQVTKLLIAFERLWIAWQVDLFCPETLSARKRYTTMVYWMENEVLTFNQQLEIFSVNVCKKREEGICPFADESACVCKQREDADKLLQLRKNDPDDQSGATAYDAVLRWLSKDREVLYNPWDIEIDDEHVDYKKFMAEEDMMAWLYFYRPDHRAELDDEEPVNDAQDFDDFDWESEFDKDTDDLPF